MNTVKILKPFRISPDGLRVELWKAGDVKTVGDDTLRILIDEGACEISEAKNDGPAPENKMRTGAPQRKRKGRK